jgi:hypothetical protein
MGWARRQRRSSYHIQKRLGFCGAFVAASLGYSLPSHAQSSFPLAPVGTGTPQSTTPVTQLMSVHGGFRELTPNLRVIGGEWASHADWKSLVLVQAEVSGKQSLCGGTVISPQWVLTAGHCVAGKQAADFSIIEGIDDLKSSGHKLRVDRVVLHENYISEPPRNDIALLHITSEATSPSQALMSRNLAQAKLRPGTNTMLAGFGLTTVQPLSGAHSGSVSDHLLQVGLPFVERSACARIIANVYHMQPTQMDFLDESTICAGDPVQGGRDACNGDSGGPLAVNLNSRQVQAGVVSWGPGCGLRDTVGIYTSIGYFETWIRQNVRDAVFVTLDEGTPVHTGQGQPTTNSSTGANAEPCGLPPAPVNPGIRLDVMEGPRVGIGTAIHVRATPNVTGQLLVFNVDTQTCRTRQIFPNQFSQSVQVGSVIAAGATVSIPEAGTFSIRVSPPGGQNRLYAMMVPPGVAINDLASRGLNMRDLTDAPSLWRELSRRMRDGRDSAPPIEAVGMYSYEIVP